jgi:4-aminobutyrate aminotransferase / (S)-3-amino-2-methylpropionate transaminase / 5-aminovalerate transaminase
MSSHVFSREPVAVPLVETSNRRIATAIPAPGTRTLLESLDKYESRSMHGQLPLIWHKATGHTIQDQAGNRWIDFTSMIFVANVGHGNQKLISRVQESISQPMLGCYAYPNEIRARYLEKLVKFAGPNFEKAFLLSAGTEATEAAFKLMKMHGQKIGKKKNVILAVSGNWHGRTLGAQMMSDNKSQKSWVGHNLEDITHIDFPYPWVLQEKNPSQYLMESLEKLEATGISLREDVAGVMLETFQGWAAVFYPKEYVQALREVCDANDILLCFDEMQSGFGRTGKKFGYEHYEVKADLICCGKGMGGGFPISGVIGKAEVMDLPEVGNMSSTHSGNPVMCAAGLAVIEEIEEKNLIKESARKGDILHYELLQIKSELDNLISGVYGKGLIASIVFKDPETGLPNSEFVSLVAEKCMQKGLLVVHTGRESIKIGPPLVITDEALLEGISIIRESILELMK